MKFLVFGGSGQLGSAVVAECGRLRDHVLAPPHAELDVTDWEAVRRCIEESSPDVALNCAVFQPVARCEQESEAANAVNTYAVANMALACRRAGVRLVQVSTDFVFDGLQDGPYVESSRQNPLQVYGRGKLAAEYAVLGANPLNLVVRTASLFGVSGRSTRGGDCPARILAAASAKPKIKARSDLRMSPTYIPDLAAALVTVAKERWAGILHLAGGEPATWAELAARLLKAARIKATVRVVASMEDPFPRPVNSVLASERTLALPGYSGRLEEYVARWKASQKA